MSAPRPEISSSYVLSLCVECERTAVPMFLGSFRLNILAFEIRK